MSTPDFFRTRLDAMIDLRHPLAVLATRMPWGQIEATLAPAFARRARDGQSVEGEDMFGPTLAVAPGGVSAAGRPRLPIRLMVGLLYLKHTYNESDESACERWAGNSYWQYFCGEEYFQPRQPCDPTNLGRLRRALGEAGTEELLDTTVQKKAIAYPTDSRLLEVARAKFTRVAQRAGLTLKQIYAREGRSLLRRTGGSHTPTGSSACAACSNASARSRAGCWRLGPRALHFLCLRARSPSRELWANRSTQAHNAPCELPPPYRRLDS